MLRFIFLKLYTLSLLYFRTCIYRFSFTLLRSIFHVRRKIPIASVQTFLLYVKKLTNILMGLMKLVGYVTMVQLNRFKIKLYVQNYSHVFECGSY